LSSTPSRTGKPGTWCSPRRWPRSQALSSRTRDEARAILNALPQMVIGRIWNSLYDRLPEHGFYITKGLSPTRTGPPRRSSSASPRGPRSVATRAWRPRAERWKDGPFEDIAVLAIAHEPCLCHPRPLGVCGSGMPRYHRLAATQSTPNGEAHRQDFRAGSKR